MTDVSSGPAPQQGVRQLVSLREQLGAAPEPDFELTVPQGWQRVATDEGGEQMLERRLRERMMAAGRPDLMAGLRRLLKESFEQMRESGAVATFMPLDPDGRGYVEAPTSISAVLRTGTPEEPLDRYVQQAIRQFRAEPLFGDLRTLRFETELEQEVDGTTIVASSTHYITPMPGTRRRRALELVATYGRPPGVARSSDTAQAMHGLFDICASTLRWVPPRGLA